MPKIPEPVRGNVVLTGYVDIPEDRFEAVANALPVHVDLTRAEQGCLYFSVVRDENRSFRLNVSEVFEDRAAFELHQHRAASSDWADVTSGIERNYKVHEVK